jgi:23S rRNA (uracil1939-C5)-methyltransferase
MDAEGARGSRRGGDDVRASPPARAGRRPGDGPRTPRLTPEARRLRLGSGKHVTVRFDRMGPDGEALASVGGRTLLVPYAAPGDEATVRLVDMNREGLRGEIVTLTSISTRITKPPCPHFGRCGGCQWQHLDYPTQLEQKTLLVRDALADAGLSHVSVDATVGWDPPWEFRTRLEAAVSVRDGRPVVGFFAWGGERVVDVRTCPVQHPGNVAVLAAVRAALNALAPVTPGSALAPAAMTAARGDAASALGQGVLRGIAARVGAATGEVLIGLAVSEELTIAARAMVVRALLDRVPGLVSIMELRVPRRSHLIRGHSESLLWGRPYIRDEAAGVRYHIPALAEFPSNARAFPGIIETILSELDPGGTDTIFEPDAGIGAYTLHLALAAGRVIGITGEDWLDAAWANARLNRIGNCVFYTRDPLKALEKFARRGAVRLAFLHPRGAGLSPELVRGLRQNGIERIVYLGGTLRTLARDAAALVRSRYRIVRAQPMDVSPHTSRVAVLLTASDT